MSSLVETLKRRTYWIVAHVCLNLYRWFPLFGSLRASLAIIHREGKVLVIQRNDGRGVSLPGGIAGWKEREELALRREVREETGLTVMSEELQTRYHSTIDVPCKVSVFHAQVSGELENSWEGSPQWMTVAELEPQLLESQRPVLESMRKILDATN